MVFLKCQHLVAVNTVLDSSSLTSTSPINQANSRELYVGCVFLVIFSFYLFRTGQRYTLAAGVFEAWCAVMPERNVTYVAAELMK